MTLTAQERKERPLARGVLDYFPDALMEVAHTSYIGNEQHNPGQPLHWAKGKSTDEADALLRHLKDRGTRDTDGVRHSAKVAWRALAMLQREIEAEREAGYSETEPFTLAELEQVIVDDSQSQLAEQVAANINGLVDFDPTPWAPADDFEVMAKQRVIPGIKHNLEMDHGSDNGELPAPHGSRPSHYEGDFGSLSFESFARSTYK